MITTTQSAIAADLEAFEKASWFTSAYLIAMSSMAPLMGRLSQVFSPRLCIFVSSMIMTVGVSITSLASTFSIFILGRVVTGIGGAGLLTIATILIVQLAAPKQRGLFLGLANSTMTLGVSLGAVVAGALAPRIGWVSQVSISKALQLCHDQVRYMKDEIINGPACRLALTPLFLYLDRFPV